MKYKYNAYHTLIVCIYPYITIYILRIQYWHALECSNLNCTTGMLTLKSVLSTISFV